ncbi:GNAT family N-acetyltransferase [Haploplasma axanthum]|uniref:Uncharacterized conserved protein n=1 Tax=Haploplasma axanthum TaxID=29552 RepID=A0A449BDS7_HAPAX|nr:GNAT family N-acetyltransferase [Haploplasma axanthum]VEU80585.1 Uncharacterized conserved protein [Haploplasma axanthum]
MHKMNLNNEPFQMIKDNTKTIELRLNDEKRSKIKTGDYILFINTKDKSKMIVEVLKISKFENFEELYKKLPLDKCGYKEEEIEYAKAADMNDYYSTEQQAKYGVLGIHIKRVEIKEMIKLEDMRKEHYEGKGYVHYQSWNETYTGIMNQEFLDKRSLEKCILIAEKYPVNTIVATLNNNVLGFAAFNQSSDNLELTGEIYAIYILEDYQNFGIGKMLLNECFKRLKEYKNIVLYVLEGNEKAINWYIKQGFYFDEKVKIEETSVKGYNLVELRMKYDLEKKA